MHFGHCPVTKLDGYRHFALCYLKQVQVLDGIVVSVKDRTEAEDAYVDQVLRFKEKVDQVCLGAARLTAVVCPREAYRV